ncbi:uncharacterized protein B0H18DRAFT_1017937, partial [Fomitopsis serialis]|uniref:uncharacterized protein n=1 Tax=Fomitopsis serialis TaxID=139415 RepID=UPI002007849B
MLTYVAGKRRLPVQWTAWLTHTRIHPPTVEELHADLERQRRVLQNAALIEARDREERALQLRMAAADQGVAVNAPAVRAAKQEAAASPVQPAGHPPSASDIHVTKKGLSKFRPLVWVPRSPAPCQTSLKPGARVQSE